jgi:hypothetical protein
MEEKMVSFKTSETDYTTDHFKALHEVHMTGNLERANRAEARDFIQKRIGEFGGRWQDDSPMPTMLFDRPADAERFADELSQKLNIPRQHIAVRASK